MSRQMKQQMKVPIRNNIGCIFSDEEVFVINLALSEFADTTDESTIENTCHKIRSKIHNIKRNGILVAGVNLN